MPKTIKSSTRKLLYTMMDKFENVKSEFNRKHEQKMLQLALINSLTPLVGIMNNEDLKLKLFEIVKELKTLEQNDMVSCETHYLEKISSMTDVSVKTLRRIKKEGSQNQGEWITPGRKRPRSATVSNLNHYDISIIRSKINEFYNEKKRVPTLRTLHHELIDAIGVKGSYETLRNILHKNGFEFQNNQTKQASLVEKYEIIAWRHRYLRTIHEKRLEGKQIIYLDETYVHQNYKTKKSRRGSSSSATSSGKRHIIMHAGSEQGFVPEALLVFSTKSKSPDCHDDMNATFMKWLEEMLIPNLTKPSVLVMDNASYHVIQVNKPPTMSDTKSDICIWLQNNNVHFEENHTKAELMCLVRDNKPTPVYKVEEILQKNSHVHKHEILFLPPFHHDLNAIELAFSEAKITVASKMVEIPGSEMQNLIKECFLSITASDWKKYTDCVRNVENQYRLRDGIVENEPERFLINDRNNSSSDSDLTSLSDVEYLESDFDYES